MVDRASNPLTAVASAVGNVVGRPFYDAYDAAKEYSKTIDEQGNIIPGGGYQGEFSFTPQGAVDFLGNLKSLGGEFLDQKPGTMMAGALKGGIESLGTQLGEGVYDFIHGPNIKFKQQQLLNKRKQDFQNIVKAAEEKKAADAAAAAAAAASKAKQQKNYSNWRSPSGRDHKSTAGIGSKESKKGPAGGSIGASRFRANGGLMMASGGLAHMVGE
jgi:hypothetical protein